MNKIAISLVSLFLSSAALAGGHAGKCEKMGKVTKAKNESACTKAGGKWSMAGKKHETKADAPMAKEAATPEEAPAEAAPSDEAPATEEGN